MRRLLQDGGWRPGNRAEWDVVRALFPARAVAFMQATQPKQWESMAGLHGDNLERLIVEALVKELDLKGTLDVLRHGFKFYGKTFRLAWFKPAHGLNPEALAQFARNELTGHAASPVSPRRRRDRGPGLRAQRSAGGHLRAQESDGPARPGAAPCGSTSRTATPARPSSNSKNAPWSTSPPIPTRFT